MAQFMGNELLQGELVNLARPEKEEMEMFARWSHDIGYQRNLRRGMVYPSAAGDWESWFTQMIDKEEGFPFSVRRRDDDRLVGFSVIKDIFWQARHCQVVIGIDPAQQGRGYGTDAMRVLLKYSFLEMNLNRVGLDVLGYNSAALRVYQKVGFRLEGTLRSFAFRDGVYYDMHTMGILRSEWERLYGQAAVSYSPSDPAPA
ncbi:MAG: GNAT family N-acetyltransferase [Anaerolineae bacterium]|nr:GNAT family N-acetyltransferase [Anaerolineae bacterium]